MPEDEEKVSLLRPSRRSSRPRPEISRNETLLYEILKWFHYHFLIPLMVSDLEIFARSVAKKIFPRLRDLASGAC